ncbi:MAG: GlcNAc-PI de-N-acetylase [Caldilineae bacterium]|nr:MAG: GlcNAc-PI de-N-acetylase [Caldilineae bacterium]
MIRKPTLLGVFAHPDDESFGPGGTLAKYAAEGVDVHVIIATDGDAGSVEDSHQRQNGRTLAQERGEELARAAVALGVTSIWNLPYRDSGMRGAPDNDHPRALIQQPLEKLVDELADYIRRLRPHVIITHDPYGGYGHPDHIRVCEAVTAAFHRVREEAQAAAVNGRTPYAPQKLYYTAFDKRLLRWVVRIMEWTGKNPRAIGRNQDIDLVEISQWETPVHARIRVAPYLDKKEAASRAHASQYGGGPAFLRVLPSFVRRKVTGNETFTRAYPAPPAKPETDLFAGVQLNDGA